MAIVGMIFLYIMNTVQCKVLQSKFMYNSTIMEMFKTAYFLKASDCRFLQFSGVTEICCWQSNAFYGAQ